MENETELLIQKLHKLYNTSTLEGLVLSLQERIEELEIELEGYPEDDGD